MRDALMSDEWESFRGKPQRDLHGGTGHECAGDKRPKSIGRSGEIRTPDPHNPIVVRYQAALRPDRDMLLTRLLAGRNHPTERRQ